MAISLDTSPGKDLNMFRMQETYRIHGRRLVPPPKLDSIMENVSGASSPERPTRPSALFQSVQNATSMAQKPSPPKSQPQTLSMAPPPPPPAAPPPSDPTRPTSPPSQGTSARAKRAAKKKKTEGKNQKTKARKPVVRRVAKRPSTVSSVRVRPARRVRLPIKKAPAPPPTKTNLPTTGNRERERDHERERDREREAMKAWSRERDPPRGWDPETRSIYQQNLVERLAAPKMLHSERVNLSIHPGSVPTDLLRTEEDKKIWARWHPPRASVKTPAEGAKKKQKRRGKGEGGETSDTDNEILAEEKATLKRGSKVPGHRIAARRKRRKGRAARRPASTSGSTKGAVKDTGGASSTGAASADREPDENESTDSKRGTSTNPPAMPPKAAFHLARITTRPRSKHIRHPAAGHLVRPPGTEQSVKASATELKARERFEIAETPRFEDTAVAKDQTITVTAMEIAASRKHGSSATSEAYRKKGIIKRRAVPASRAVARDRSNSSRNASSRATAANTRMRLRRAILAAAKSAKTQSPKPAQGKTIKVSATSSAVAVAATRASIPNKSPSVVVAAAATGGTTPTPSPPNTLQAPHRRKTGSRAVSAAPSSKGQDGGGGGGKKTSSAPANKRQPGTPKTIQASIMKKIPLDKVADYFRAMVGEASPATSPVVNYRWPRSDLPDDLVEALGPTWTSAAESYLRRRGLARNERASYRTAHRTSGATKTLRRLSAGLGGGRGSPHTVTLPIVSAVSTSGKVGRPRTESPSIGMPVALPAVLHPALGQPLPSARRTRPALPKHPGSGRVRFVSPGGSGGSGAAALADRAGAWADSVVPRHGWTAKGSSKGVHELKTIKAPRPEQYLKNVSSDDEVPVFGEKTQRMPPPPTLPRLAALFAATGGSQNNAVRRLVMGGRAARTRPYVQNINTVGPNTKSGTPEAEIEADRRLLGRARPAPAVRV